MKSKRAVSVGYQDETKKTVRVEYEDGTSKLTPKSNYAVNPDLQQYQEEALHDVQPYPVDETLLEMIEDGYEKLTDELFFELIEESPAYLASRPFLKRIAEWQCVMTNPIYEGEEKKAKDNLRKVGTTLAMEQQGRPEINSLWVYRKYDNLKNAIIKFSKERNVESVRLLRELTKAYPKYKAYFDLKRRQPRAPREIAIEILAGQIKVSVSRIEAAIKDWEKS